MLTRKIFIVRLLLSLFLGSTIYQFSFRIASGRQDWQDMLIARASRTIFIFP